MLRQNSLPFCGMIPGIALILFGILLCVCSGEVNGTVLSDFSYFPFATIGLIAGIVGLGMIFHKSKDENDN